MLASVYLKSVRDRTLGILVGAGSLGLLLLFGMAAYREIDVSFYYGLPPALLELMGIPPQGDVAGIAFGAMYNLMGAFTLAGLAISMGAYAVAGEERQGTLGLLLANPLSRHGIVVSKAAGIVTVTGIGALILWLFGVVSPSWLDVDMTGIHVAATILALFLNALVYGFLALAIGSWTGSRHLASGVAVGVMLIGYLAASLLPLVESVDWLAEFAPWYYFSASQPVINGVDWGDVAVLGSVVVVCFAIAYLGIARRDLRDRGADVTIGDRLRASPRTRRIMDRIAGSARVSAIWIKTGSEFQGLIVIVATVLFYLGVLIALLYGLIPDDIFDFFQDFPDALVAMVGGADLGSAAGFLQGEIFAITAPGALTIVTAVMGARAVAGEEESKTMGLLLSNPVSRGRIVIEKTSAMVMHSVSLGLVTFVATWIGIRLGGLEVTTAGLAATCLLLVLMALVFGGIALAVGAATGKVKLAAGATAGAALVAYFGYAFLPLAESYAGWAALSPFHFYLGSDPLTTGFDWGDAAVLGVVFLVLVTIAVPLLRRRDLRG